MTKFRHYVIRQDHISSSQLWQCDHLPPQVAAFLHKSHHAQSRRNNQQVMDLRTRASSWGVRSGGGQFLSFSSDTAAIRGCCGSNLRRDGGRGDTTINRRVWNGPDSAMRRLMCRSRLIWRRRRHNNQPELAAWLGAAEQELCGGSRWVRSGDDGRRSFVRWLADVMRWTVQS
jgi:hypothetical protein